MKIEWKMKEEERDYQREGGRRDEGGGRVMYNRVGGNGGRGQY